MHNFGKLLKALRIKAEYTQKDLADKLNTTTTTVSSWENGKRYPDIITLREISQVLHVSYDDLLNPSETLEKCKSAAPTHDGNKNVDLNISDKISPEPRLYRSIFKKKNTYICLMLLILCISFCSILLFASSNNTNFEFIQCNNNIETPYGTAYELIYLQDSKSTIEDLSAYADILAENWHNGEYADAVSNVFVVSFYLSKEDAGNWSKCNYRSFYFLEYTP